MSLSIHSLPNELLDRISSFVGPHSSLFHLALVSRKFNLLMTPHLYRDVFLESINGVYGTRHLLPFTFTILQNPYLASLVQAFTFRGDFLEEGVATPDPDDKQARLPWPNHPDRDDILRRVVKEISQSEKEESEWLEEILPLYPQRDDAIFALLLTSLPKLRRLDFEIDDYRVEYLESVFDRIASRKPPFDTKPVFAQLTDVMLTDINDKSPMHYVLFGACCHFPAVRHLYGHRLGAEEYASQFRMFNSWCPASPIETLELRDSKLHLDDLPSILGPLKCLHTLIYKIGNSWAWTSVQTPKILSALSLHASSLRRLALDHEDYYPFESHLDYDDPSPLSFAAFTALTHLRVAPVFLFGDADLQRAPKPGSSADTMLRNRLCGALPQQLENLYVTHAEFVFKDEHAHIGSAFEMLLQHKKRCSPHLRELVFEGSFDGEMMIHHVGRVLRAAEEKRVNARAIYLTKQYACDHERGWGWDEKVQFEKCMHNRIGRRSQLLPEAR